MFIGGYSSLHKSSPSHHSRRRPSYETKEEPGQGTRAEQSTSNSSTSRSSRNPHKRHHRSSTRHKHDSDRGARDGSSRSRRSTSSNRGQAHGSGLASNDQPRETPTVSAIIQMPTSNVAAPIEPITDVEHTEQNQHDDQILPITPELRRRSATSPRSGRSQHLSSSSQSSQSHPPRPSQRSRKSPVSSTKPGAVACSTSGNSSSQRSRSTNPKKRTPSAAGILYTLLFGSPKPKPPPPKKVPPEKKVTCVICMSDEIPISKSAKLKCSHRMCQECLVRIFTLSTTDPQHMPPRCCTAEPISTTHVDKLFDREFKTKWCKKYREFTAKDRVYCPARGCGEWILPANIHHNSNPVSYGDRKYGKCTRCRTKVCCACNGKWHKGKECPEDEETQKFVKIAQKEGWKRCYNCSAMVELKEGCNHMTCRCKAEFCMICTAKWKTCGCPWFNYQDTGDGLLLNLGLEGLIAPGNQPRPVRYQEELERRRHQEEEDGELARRLQRQLIDAEFDDDNDNNGNDDNDDNDGNGEDQLRAVLAAAATWNLQLHENRPIVDDPFAPITFETPVPQHGAGPNPDEPPLENARRHMFPEEPHARFGHYMPVLNLDDPANQGPPLFGPTIHYHVPNLPPPPMRRREGIRTGRNRGEPAQAILIS
ncbi:hypothetical protein FQN57_007345 [Myotisia sp. PD_48]|nr:hypothetical protein FQN57_007345 [Myotisia sp. PD_48]